jgi:cytoskeletal protein CcmA (bactofilin family)
MMFGKRKNRKPTKIDSLIGRNTRVQGDMSFEGGLHVDGTVKGDVYPSRSGFRQQVAMNW